MRTTHNFTNYTKMQQLIVFVWCSCFVLLFFKTLQQKHRNRQNNHLFIFVLIEKNAYLSGKSQGTDKETDASWDIFMIWKINSGQWAVGCGLGWTVKKKGLGQLWATFEARFLSFYGQKMNLKFFWKYFRVHTEKLHRIKVNKSQKNFGKWFLCGKNQFF